MKRTDLKISRSLLSLLTVTAIFYTGSTSLSVSSEASENNNEAVKAYQLLSDEFLHSLNSVQAETFFNPPLDPPPFNKQWDTNNSEHYAHIKQFSRVAEDYRKRGHAVCESIASKYDQMLDKPFNKEESFKFDTELSRAMREAGAFVLPIRVYDGQIKVEYFNPEWKTSSSEFNGNSAFAKNLNDIPSNQRLSVQYEKAGKITVNPLMNENGGDYMDFRFVNEVAQKSGLVMGDYQLSFNFVRPYLFIFHEDPKDIQSETITFYIDLPYSVESNKFGEINKLKKVESKKNSNHSKPQCYVLSKTGLQIKQVENPVFQDGTKFLTNIGRLEPITDPLRVEYAEVKVPRPDGRTGLVKAPDYTIQENEISEPSLECWLGAMGLIEARKSCADTGYAKEFLALMNNTLCVSDKVQRIPQITYPMTIKPRNTGQDFYTTTAGGINNRCNDN